MPVTTAVLPRMKINLTNGRRMTAGKEINMGHTGDGPRNTSNDGRASAVHPLVMAPAGIKAELIRIAALLAQCIDIPSDLVDDYPQKTYSASRVARMMDKAHQTYPMLAYQLRQLSDSIHVADVPTQLKPVICRSSTTGDETTILVVP